MFVSYFHPTEFGIPWGFTANCEYEKINEIYPLIMYETKKFSN